MHAHYIQVNMTYGFKYIILIVYNEEVTELYFSHFYKTYKIYFMFSREKKVN